jgi:hypothetical protein
LHYNLILVPSLGDLQDNSTKRIETYKKGYMKGTTDLIILNPNKYYNGIAIEFKSPTLGFFLYIYIRISI